MITEQEILRYISKQPRHMAGYKQILHDLGIRGKDRRPVEQLLREMTRHKKLVLIGKERWGLPTSASSQDLVMGKLHMHRDGYGFVTPEPDSLPARARGKLLGDIFIPPPEIGNAMHGDQVLVELGRIRPDGKGEGRILRVTEREQETVVGIFHYGDRHNHVKPFDERIGMEIIIPHGMEYPKADEEEEFQGLADRDTKTGSRSNQRVAQAPSPMHGQHRKGTLGEEDTQTQETRAAQTLLSVQEHGSDKKHWGGEKIEFNSAQPRAAVPHGAAGAHAQTSGESHSRTQASHKAPSPNHPARQTPHRVLGEEALRKGDWDDLENVVVEVEIIQFPSATHEPRGRVVEILGYEDDFGVDVEIMIRKHHIRHVFPPEVLEEAQEISPVVPSSEIARRRDYRELPIVTIDGETARDFDDAVFVRRLAHGHYELQVHIADVAQYVEDGSAIDDEARKRGTSVYFPDRAVPMLPLELSTDICSLRPQVERLVLSCIMEIDPHGEIVSYDLAEGVIRSAHRMTYTDVNAIIEGDAHLRRKYAAMVENFELMYELAQVLNRKRVKRGSIDFDLPEPVIEFDENGLMKSVTPSERNWAHRLIEEFMLAANETVAAHLEQRGIASLYRIHEKPDPKRIFEFEQIAASFGYSLGVGALPIKRVTTRADKRSHYGSGRRAPVIELPEEVHITPRMYQKLVSKITGKAEERVLSYLMLRSLKQARYSEVNEGHFALAASTYTHFTSPIRRYPDLIVHRILKEVLKREAQGPVRAPVQHEHERQSRLLPFTFSSLEHSPWSKRHQQDQAQHGKSRTGSTTSTPSTKLRAMSGLSLETLHDIADSSSQAERAADEAERELMEWKKLKFMEGRLGDHFDALIVNVMKFGFFVELTELFIEGLVPIDTLEEDHYTYRENTRQIIGQHSGKIFSIGDRVRVLADRIDHVQRKIQFALVADTPSRAQKRHKRPHR
jgi:ribonuclease R